MLSAERKLELLRKLNPTGIEKGLTQSVADDCKWAAESIALLTTYIAACPCRGYWSHIAETDERVAELLKGLL